MAEAGQNALQAVRELKAMLKNLSATIYSRPHKPDNPECMKAAFDVWGGFLGP